MSQVNFREDFIDFIRKVDAAELQYSQHATPGGGSHAPYIFGSAVIEQQLAFSCKVRFQAFMATQQLPNSSQNYRIFLNALLHFLATVKPEAGEFFQNQLTVDISSSSYNFAGPAAFDAMRLRLQSIIRTKLFLLAEF